MEEQKSSPQVKSNNAIVILLILLVIILSGMTGYLFLSNSRCIDDKALLQDQLNSNLQEDDTDIPTEVEESSYSDEEFYVSYSIAPDSTKYYFTTKVPQDAEISGEDTASTKIEFNDSYLTIMISHMVTREEIESSVVIDEQGFLEEYDDKLYRVINESGNIYYSTLLGSEVGCDDFGITAPCAGLAVGLDDNNDGLLYLSIEFIGDENDLITADEIVSNLEFVKEV